VGLTRVLRDNGRVSQTKPDEDAPDQTPAKEAAKLDISLPKLLAGALAAVTTAVVGSQLGVAGTIIGAAFASVVGAVASSLYTVGLDRTHRGVAQAIRRGYERVRGTSTDEADAPATAAIGLAEPAGPDVATTATRKRVLRNALVATGAILGVTIVAITAWELGVGYSLDGSKGTTVSQVVRPEPARTTPATTPSATPTATATSATPTPTATTAATPTATTTPATQTSAPTPTGATTSEPATTAPATTAAAGPTSSQTAGG